MNLILFPVFVFLLLTLLTSCSTVKKDCEEDCVTRTNITDRI